jgi:hypothetical protein
MAFRKSQPKMAFRKRFLEKSVAKKIKIKIKIKQKIKKPAGHWSSGMIQSLGL